MSGEQSRATDGNVRAHLRALSDALLDPQLLLEAVRGPGGNIIDFVFLELNSAATADLGLSREELLGRSVAQTFPDFVDQGLLARCAQCVRTGEPLILDDVHFIDPATHTARRLDIRAARANADWLSLTWRDMTGRYDSDQHVRDSEQRYRVLGEEVSAGYSAEEEQQQLQAAQVAQAELIAASEERYRLLAENSADVVIHAREDNESDPGIVWVSQNVQGLLGAPAEYWIGRKMTDFIPPEECAGYYAVKKETIETGAASHRGRVQSMDGVMHWVHVRTKRYVDAQGNQDGAVIALRMIDNEVAAEQAAEQMRREKTTADELFRRSMGSATVGMCLTTPEGRFIEVNDALCAYFGYDAESLKQMTWKALSAPGHLEEDLLNVGRMIAGEMDSFRRTKQYVRSDGRLIWGDLSVGCIRDEHGQVERLIAQIIDVTATIEADERNRDLAEELKQKNDLLQSDLDSAAIYLKSIMPTGLRGAIEVTSLYLPARQLGGDCYDYDWIDDDHLMVYLIDVSGHGVEPALLSVSVHNMLRSGSLSTDTLLDPAAVLTELNRLFQMERQGGHFFTLWYGVYDKTTRTLQYASAGAPPPYAFTPTDGTVTDLIAQSRPIGMFEDTEFATARYTVPSGCRILLYSDGASELALGDGQWLSHETFKAIANQVAGVKGRSLEHLVNELRHLTPFGDFDDDCSLVLIAFD